MNLRIIIKYEKIYKTLKKLYKKFTKPDEKLSTVKERYIMGQHVEMGTY